MNWMLRASGLLSLVLLNACFSLGYASTGGPDLYGYTWKDSNEPDLNFDWVEVAGRAGASQIAGLADDNAVGPISFGWDFHYYWSDYNSLKLGSNGWLAFSNIGNIASCFPQIPTAGGVGDNIIAPFLSDLTFVSNSGSNPNQGRLWFWTNNTDSLVLEWVNVPWWQNSTPDWVGSNTFQVILAGQDSSITFQYLSTTPNQFPSGTGCNTYLEIGIENVTGDIGLNYSTGSFVPPSNYAIKFIYPSGAAFQVPDATPLWNLNSDNAAQFVYAGAPLLLNTTLRNIGNAPISSQIKALGQVKDLQLNELWRDSVSVNGLVVGSDLALGFTDTLFLTAAGQYFFDVTASDANNEDINPTNNFNSIELAAVENSTGYARLSYATGFPPSDAVSWAGGNPNDGLALKMVPPGFPAIIDTVKIYMIGDGDPQTPAPVGFTIKIFGLDANGQPNPNDLLHTAQVVANDVIEDAWNAVAISPAVTIASDGFAVAWFQAGTGLSVGAEQFGPISRRTYEILGGAWSPYRNNEDTELLIAVQTSMPVANSPKIEFATDLQVWPNPITDGILNLAYSINQNADLHLSIVNVHGQVLLSKDLGKKHAGSYLENLDLKLLSEGLYFLNLDSKTQRISRKIVVLGK